MVVVIKFAFETMQHVVNLREAGFFQCVPGVQLTVAAAADDNDGPVHTGGFFDVCDEVRVDLPVRTVVPGDMYGPGGMTDEQVFHFAAAIDKY